MQIGMLWFDDTNKSLAERIERAARHYEDRWEKAPEVCYVHPTELLASPELPKHIEVRTREFILPHHIWIGMAGPSETPEAA